ncbi:MAG: hypothetical protein U9R42_12420, partial [Bacteroidota bacterium]|nr:hypothetical protein [Bacteroidota bacterium]
MKRIFTILTLILISSPLFSQNDEFNTADLRRTAQIVEFDHIDLVSDKQKIQPDTDVNTNKNKDVNIVYPNNGLTYNKYLTSAPRFTGKEHIHNINISKKERYSYNNDIKDVNTNRDVNILNPDEGLVSDNQGVQPDTDTNKNKDVNIVYPNKG